MTIVHATCRQRRRVLCTARNQRRLLLCPFFLNSIHNFRTRTSQWKADGNLLSTSGCCNDDLNSISSRLLLSSRSNFFSVVSLSLSPPPGPSRFAPDTRRSLWAIAVNNVQSLSSFPACFFSCPFALQQRWSGVCAAAATRTVGTVAGRSLFFPGLLLSRFVRKTNKRRRRRRRVCDQTKGGVTELLLEPFLKLLFATLIIYHLPAVSWLLMKNLFLELLASRLAPKGLQIWCVCLSVCLLPQWFAELLPSCVLHVFASQDDGWEMMIEEDNNKVSSCFVSSS